MATVPVGFHEGELAVQRRAGVRTQAQRLTGMLAPPTLHGGASLFLAEREVAVLTARDAEGLLWTVPLAGAAGFLDVVDDTTLDVLALPDPAGPLGAVRLAGSEVGLLTIDFATRRRFRVNGTVAATGPTGFAVAAAQAYGNCPQYIQRRDVDVDVDVDVGEAAADATGTARLRAVRREALGASDIALIERADTFFLGTAHPTRGADASHRGGAPGFVRVESGADGGSLWWPDYPGNNMFNSLGNIAADGEAALLFPDFTGGTALHLSGGAVIEWTEPGTPGDDGGTGRRVRFTPRRIVSTAGPLHAADVTPYPRNPRLTDRTPGR